MRRFNVCVVEARNVPIADLNGLSDPYCCVDVVRSISDPRFPSTYGGTAGRRTRTIRRTLNPVWNETIVVDSLSPMTDQLLLRIYDYDRFSDDDFLGSAFIPISQIAAMPRYDAWVTLNPARVTLRSNAGQIHVIITPGPVMGGVGVVPAPMYGAAVPAVPAYGINAPIYGGVAPMYGAPMYTPMGYGARPYGY